jgi:hypothetical protein
VPGGCASAISTGSAFGEPAWDMLLALYVSEQSAGRLTMSRLAELVEAP